MVIKSEAYSYGLFATPTNKKIIRELESNGAKIFKFPVLESEKIKLNAGQTALLESITDFDWIIFPDVLAVDNLIETLNENDADLFDLDQVRVCVFGEAVADRLRFSELHADIIAGSTDPEKVFKELLNYLAGEDLAQLKFLIPKSESDNFELAGKLRDAQSEVLELPVYRIKSKKNPQTTKIKTLLSGGAIDEFIFSDPLDLLGLKNLFPGVELKEILVDVKISATDQIMFQALTESGLAPKFFSEIILL